MYNVGQLFSPEVIVVIIAVMNLLQILMAQTTNTHNKALAKLCRVCGQLLSTAGRSTYCTKNSQSLLKSVFGIEVEAR